MAPRAIPTAVVASGSAEWYSPPELVEPARSVFGGFDLDPASCAKANSVIRAANFFTAEDDGRSRDWDVSGEPSRVWLNPPSDAKNDERAAEWWVKLASEFMRGHVRCAAFVVFNLSTVQVALAASRRAGLPPPQWGSRVEPDRRIAYYRTARTLPLPGFDAEFERGKQPPHPSAVILLSDEPALHAAWREAYAGLGEVIPPAKTPVRTARACSRKPVGEMVATTWRGA